MSRIRTIKPDFFLNDTIADLPALDRLLFIGLWTIADKSGRLEEKSRKIKAKILPYDDWNIDEALDRLSQKRFILRYEVEGEKYIQINNFLKHQRPNIKESASTIPEYSQHIPECAKHEKENHLMERKGKERKGKEYIPEFLLFWEKYKKKVDKPHAFACWQKRLADGIAPEQIIKHTEAYNARLEAEKTEMQYIKHPATFLNRTDFSEMAVSVTPPPQLSASVDEPDIYTQQALREAAEGKRKRDEEEAAWLANKEDNLRAAEEFRKEVLEGGKFAK